MVFFRKFMFNAGGFVGRALPASSQDMWKGKRWAVPTLRNCSMQELNMCAKSFLLISILRILVNRIMPFID